MKRLYCSLVWRRLITSIWTSLIKYVSFRVGHWDPFISSCSSIFKSFWSFRLCVINNLCRFIRQQDSRCWCMLWTSGKYFFLWNKCLFNSTVGSSSSRWRSIFINLCLLLRWTKQRNRIKSNFLKISFHIHDTLWGHFFLLINERQIDTNDSCPSRVSSNPRHIFLRLFLIDDAFIWSSTSDLFFSSLFRSFFCVLNFKRRKKNE